MIRFECPACSKIYRADDAKAGKKTVCKSCNSIVMIPDKPIVEILYGKSLPPDGTVEVDGVEESKAETADKPACNPPTEDSSNGSSEKINRKRSRRKSTTYPTKYCHECGRQIRAKADVCPKCGVNQGQTEFILRDVGSNSLSGKQITAGILAILLGGLGVHKFYLGYIGTGVLMLVVSLFSWVLFLCPFGWIGIGIMWIIGLIEGVIYLVKPSKQFYADYIRGQRYWF